MVQSDVDLLEGTDEEIFSAANRLTKFVGFISKYSVRSHSVFDFDDTQRQPSIQEIE